MWDFPSTSLRWSLCCNHDFLHIFNACDDCSVNIHYSLSLWKSFCLCDSWVSLNTCLITFFSAFTDSFFQPQPIDILRWRSSTRTFPRPRSNPPTAIHLPQNIPPPSSSLPLNHPPPSRSSSEKSITLTQHLRLHETRLQLPIRYL